MAISLHLSARSGGKGTSWGLVYFETRGNQMESGAAGMVLCNVWPDSDHVVKKDRMLKSNWNSLNVVFLSETKRDDLPN